MLAALLAVLALAQVAEGQAAETVRAIVAEGRHQTELPRRSPAEPAARESRGDEEGGDPAQATGAGGTAGAERRRTTPARRIPTPQVSLGPLFDVLRVLFWVLVALMAVWAVVQALRAWLGGGAAEVESPDGVSADPVEEAATGPTPALERVAELERAGRFGEAMHELLLVAFRELLGGNARAGRASTSRELARSLGLEGERRAALRQLVLSVERWLFGGAAPDREDLERCRGWYATLGRRAGSEGA